MSPKIGKEHHKNRKARKKQTAEDFTPLWLVDEMLDKLEETSPTSFTYPTKTFLDPACGNGNMLIQILKRRLQRGVDPMDNVKTIYGCDIMQENIWEARCRMLLTTGVYRNRNIPPEEVVEIIRYLTRNIVWTPLEQYPNGSLDYLSLPDNQQFQEWITLERAWEIRQNLINDKTLGEFDIKK